MTHTLLQEIFHLVSCLPLRLFPCTGASTILLSTCPSSLLLTCPYHFSLFSVIFLVTGATLLILSHDRFSSYLCYSTPPPQHPYLIHLQSLFLRSSNFVLCPFHFCFACVCFKESPKRSWDLKCLVIESHGISSANRSMNPVQTYKDFAKKTIPNIRDNFESGWMGPCTALKKNWKIVL